MASTYTFRYLEKDEFDAFYAQESAAAFADATHFDPRERIYRQEELERIAALKMTWTNRRQILIGAYDAAGALAGWSQSVQERGDEICMCMSAVKPAHQRHGIYARMLDMLLDRARELGFQSVISFHQATNNAILIPKLKAGFHVTGVEYRDTRGVLLKLTYLFNDERRHLLDVRSGFVKPDERALEILSGAPRSPHPPTAASAERAPAAAR